MAAQRALFPRIRGWLRPGGRLVIGDMMFGRGADAQDRAIIASKARSLLRRGPGGWWPLPGPQVALTAHLRGRRVPTVSSARAMSRRGDAA